jgi:hypothetical protein
VIRALAATMLACLACGGVRGPEPMEITPESIAAAARVLTEAAEKNPDFALEEGGFRVRASTYEWVKGLGPPGDPKGGFGGGPVMRRVLTEPRTTYWRLDDIHAVKSQEWVFSAAIVVHLAGHKQPDYLEIDDPAEAHRIVNAIDLLRRANLQTPGRPGSNASD